MRYFVKTPKTVRWFTRMLWKVNTQEKRVYLTFDDGPVPEVTPEVLQILKKHNVKATFFCVGDNLRKHPEVFADIIADGHCVGNHSFNHLNGWLTGIKNYYKNIIKTQAYIRSLYRNNHQKPPKVQLFRPPYGKINILQLLTVRLRYKIVSWTTITYDYDKTVSPEECLNNATATLCPGAIVVFHDSIKAHHNMSYALPRFIEYCHNEGYEFGTLDEAFA